MPFEFDLIVYNSAGEKVKLLYSGSASSSITQAYFDTEIVMGASAPLNISVDAVLENMSSDITWIGDNDGGQPLGGGISWGTRVR